VERIEIGFGAEDDRARLPPETDLAAPIQVRLVAGRSEIERGTANAAAAQAYADGGAGAMFAALIGRQRALYADGREHLATTYAAAGQRDEAMALLTAALRARDPDLVGVRIDLRLAGLHGRPDFDRLARAPVAAEPRRKKHARVWRSETRSLDRPSG
jgi:hypothetical protein